LITVRAHAKINLTLDVLGIRPDGYHDIASVMQSISLSDILTFEPADDITLKGAAEAGIKPLDNLIYQSANLLKKESGVKKGVSIEYTRGIPLSAGLGGGSSDAATTLMVLNELWGLEWSSERLSKVAAKLGSDISFFLYGGTAYIHGRGEKVTPLPPFAETWLVLLRPLVEVSSKTQKLYASLENGHYTDGEATRKVANDSLVGQTISPHFIFNAFEPVAYQFFPQLDGYRQIMLDAGASSVHLCGAGPTLFTMASDYNSAESIYQNLLSKDLEAYLTHTL
jgi:4-diphosphocytidyl-2-C-methyl-D-erythritol kinase